MIIAPPPPALLGLAETLDVLITLTPPLAGNHAGTARAGGADGVTGGAPPRWMAGPLALQTAMVGMLRALPGSLLRS